jgi:hypothetical protein
MRLYTYLDYGGNCEQVGIQGWINEAEVLAHPSGTRVRLVLMKYANAIHGRTPVDIFAAASFLATPWSRSQRVAAGPSCV